MLPPMRLTRRWCWLALGVALLVTGCGTDTSEYGAAEDVSITLYTCVNDTTIQPVIGAFQSTHPGSEVELFRAPTGELNARVASDVRSGGLKADVIWACDPLTMRDYVDQELVGGWLPEEAADMPAEFQTPTPSALPCSTWWPCTARASRRRRRGPT